MNNKIQPTKNPESRPQAHSNNLNRAESAPSSPRRNTETSPSNFPLLSRKSQTSENIPFSDALDMIRQTGDTFISGGNVLCELIMSNALSESELTALKNTLAQRIIELKDAPNEIGCLELYAVLAKSNHLTKEETNTVFDYIFNRWPQFDTEQKKHRHLPLFALLSTSKVSQEKASYAASILIAECTSVYKESTDPLFVNKTLAVLSSIAGNYTLNPENAFPLFILCLDTLKTQPEMGNACNCLAALLTNSSEFLAVILIKGLDSDIFEALKLTCEKQTIDTEHMSLLQILAQIETLDNEDGLNFTLSLIDRFETFGYEAKTNFLLALSKFIKNYTQTPKLTLNDEQLQTLLALLNDPQPTIQQNAYGCIHELIERDCTKTQQMRMVLTQLTNMDPPKDPRIIHNHLQTISTCADNIPQLTPPEKEVLWNVIQVHTAPDNDHTQCILRLLAILIERKCITPQQLPRVKKIIHSGLHQTEEMARLHALGCIKHLSLNNLCDRQFILKALPNVLQTLDSDNEEFIYKVQLVAYHLLSHQLIDPDSAFAALQQAITNPSTPSVKNSAYKLLHSCVSGLAISKTSLEIIHNLLKHGIHTTYTNTKKEIVGILLRLQQHNLLTADKLQALFPHLLEFIDHPDIELSMNFANVIAQLVNHTQLDKQWMPQLINKILSLAKTTNNKQHAVYYIKLLEHMILTGIIKHESWMLALAMKDK